MDPNEELVQTLLSMGFFEAEVRRALKLAKNDLNDAVAILTNEHPSSSFDTLEDIDVEMGQGGSSSLSSGGGGGSGPPVYGPSLPPSYDDAMKQGIPSPQDTMVL